MDFPVWKIIRLGTGLKTFSDFRPVFERADMVISRSGYEILCIKDFPTSNREMDVDLVNVSVADLGFKKRAYHKDVIGRALGSGLELCLAEVGPQLRLQYPDQPKGERLIVAMEPIDDSDGYLRTFLVTHGDDGCRLDSLYSYPDSSWDDDHRFVFSRPRK